MIVYFPTAYYETELPKGPSDAGNVTWTCSSLPPPRSTLFVDQITAMLATRLSLPPRVPGDLARRPTRGDLVFITGAADASLALYGAKQYEAGQILDFVNGTPLQLDPQLVASATEMRQDTNYLDLSKLGFSAAESAVIMVQADAMTRALLDQLNLYRQQRADVETQLSNSQLTLNEAQKAQQAIAVILEVSPSQGMQDAYDRVTTQIASITAQQQALVTQGNTLAAQSQATQDDLLTASQLVR
jgi:hypothetical protein